MAGWWRESAKRAAANLRAQKKALAAERRADREERAARLDPLSETSAEHRADTAARLAELRDATERGKLGP